MTLSSTPPSSGQQQMYEHAAAEFHNVGASHIVQQRRATTRLVSLEAIGQSAGDSEPDETVNRQLMLDRLFELVHQLQPVDRQVVLLYLDGNDATSIGEITGLSPGNVATKISRLKKILSHRAKHRSAHAS